MIYRQDQRSAARILRGEAAIIPPQDGRVSVLNEVATAIWELCADKGRSLDELISELLERYDASEDIIRSDTLELLEHLVEIGALVAE